MNNINSSNYYRANPYKDIGYMPPMAQKNRRSPQFNTQLPQGQQFFQHATKKHYQAAYKNQIQNDNIMRSVDKFSPIEQQALQRSYFRSLNAKDIEGSSTNTLISKAVKNKQKAQMELQKRKDMERQQIQALRLKQEQENNEKKRWIQNYHRQVMEAKKNSHNYSEQSPDHSNKYQNLPNSYINNSEQSELQKRKRRQRQLLRIAQQRKNYAIVDVASLYDNYKQKNSASKSGEKIPQQSLPNFHQIQLQRRKKTQQQSPRKQENNRQYYQQYQLNNQSQPVKSYGNGSKHNIYSMDNNYNQYPNTNSNNRTQQGYRDRDRGLNYNVIERDEMRKINNYDLPNYNPEPVTQQRKGVEGPINGYQDYVPRDQFRQREGHVYQNQINQQAVNKYSYNQAQNQYSYKPQPQTQSQPQNYQPSSQNNSSKPDIYQNLYSSQASESRIPAFKTREELRRHNPTYLSYGSPTFTLASKNVIGY